MDPRLEAALDDLTKRVMGRAGVVGTAIGERCGKSCLKVYVAEAKAGRNIPRSIGGFRVVVEETGSFRRL